MGIAIRLSGCVAILALCLTGLRWTVGMPQTSEYAIGADLSFLKWEANRIVLATPPNRGKGVIWWEPAVPASRNASGIFNENGNALPVITVFDKFTRK